MNKQHITGSAHFADQDTSRFEYAKSLVVNELEKTEQLMQDYLQGHVPLTEEVCNHILSGGGKRLRPLIMLLSASAIGYQGSEHIKAAAVTEFIHTATLLHDDVVDASLMRRGKATVNQQWGNEISVLVGDFIYSRTFQLITDIEDMEVMKLLASSTAMMAEGELKQLASRVEPEISLNACLEIMTYKTAKLFEVSARLAGILQKCSQQQADALAEYGLNFGMAFQLVDDILDYSGNINSTGKKVGDDLAEGKPTLPLVYAINHAPASQARWLREVLESGGTDNIEDVLNIVKATGALDYAYQLAADYIVKANQALEPLPQSVYSEGLQALASFTLSRSY